MTADPEAMRPMLVFQVGGHLCAIAAPQVSEILFHAELARSPAQPPLLDGFLNLRGTAIPVLPVHRLFGLQPPEPEVHTPLIVIAPGNIRLALRVDRVEDVVSIPAADLKPHSFHDSINACVEAQFTLHNRDAIVLSADRLLMAKERQCLEQLQREEQHRLEAIGADSA